MVTPLYNWCCWVALSSERAKEWETIQHIYAKLSAANFPFPSLLSFFVGGGGRVDHKLPLLLDTRDQQTRPLFPSLVVSLQSISSNDWLMDRLIEGGRIDQYLNKWQGTPPPPSYISPGGIKIFQGNLSLTRRGNLIKWRKTSRWPWLELMRGRSLINRLSNGTLQEDQE